MLALLIALLLNGGVATFDAPGGLPIGGGGTNNVAPIVAPLDAPGGLPIG